MCGIIGMFCVDSVNQQIYDNLLLLQHRGQDSAGVVTMDNTPFMCTNKGDVCVKPFAQETCESCWAMPGSDTFVMPPVVLLHLKRKFSLLCECPLWHYFVPNEITNTLQLSRICSRLIVATNSTSDTEMLVNGWRLRFNLNHSVI